MATKKTKKRPTKNTKKRTAKKTVKRASKKKPSRTKSRSRKKKTGDQFHALSLVNEKLSHLEGQALKAYECVQAIRKRSTPDWKEWIDKLSPQDWMALANAQRERISLEVKHLSDEILSKIHGADILSGKDSILKDAKNNLENIIDKIDNGNLVERAIDTAIHTKDGLLAFLNIPTHEEMTQLQRKLKRLERKMGEFRPKAH